ncbi:MAG: hypothetical protein ACI83D_000524 [Planctomycetota bacterium]|jgi:hypothetical protein
MKMESFPDKIGNYSKERIVEAEKLLIDTTEDGACSLVLRLVERPHYDESGFPVHEEVYHIEISTSVVVELAAKFNLPTEDVRSIIIEHERGHYVNNSDDEAAAWEYAAVEWGDVHGFEHIKDWSLRFYKMGDII